MGNRRRRSRAKHDHARKRSRALARGGLILALVLVAAMGSAWKLLAGHRTAGNGLNVVLISIDTTRADRLSAYGYGPETTPHIDAVARDGALFRQAYSTNPITLPAHSSMLTGTEPPYHGVHNNHYYTLDESNVTLAETMRDQGYNTAAFVSAFVLESRFGLDQGFDTYDDRPFSANGDINERKAEDTSRQAIRWLDENASEPFFLFLHYFDPHNPYEPPEPFASRFPESPYDGEIAYVDHCIGQVVHKLKSLGIYDSTVIVITSDHGEGLGEHEESSHSFFVYQSTIRVPLIVKAPGGASSNVVEEPAGIIDVVPTVLGLVDLDMPEEIHGQDLSSWIMGGGEPLDRAFYCESIIPMEYGCSPLRGVIQGDWKYISTTRPELYDLRKDPGETENLVSVDSDLAHEYHAKLREMLSERTRVGAVTGGRELDPQSLERLRSLGYAGGGGGPSNSIDDGFGDDDPKDFIGILTRLLRATDLHNQEQYEASSEECLAILEERPENLRALQILAGNLRQQGQLEAAVEAHGRYLVAATAARDRAGRDAALRLDYDLAEAHYNMGIILHRLARTHRSWEELDQAEFHYRKAIGLRPDTALAHNGLGALLAQKGQHQAAIDHLERALEIDPTLTSARQNLGRLRSASQ